MRYWIIICIALFTGCSVQKAMIKEIEETGEAMRQKISELDASELVPTEVLLQNQDLEVWALLIGISQYADTTVGNKLKYAHEDALKFAAFLDTLKNRNLFSDIHCCTLINKQASLKNIKDQLNNFFREANKEDYIVIYFSGHGDIDKYRNSYLLPYDTKKGEDGSKYFSTAFSIKDFNNNLSDNKMFPANNISVFIDACHSGKSVYPFTPQRHIAVFASCAASKTSFEDTSKIKGGVFTHYLLKGLYGEADIHGNSRITGEELKKYLYEKFFDNSLKRLYLPDIHVLKNFIVSVAKKIPLKEGITVTAPKPDKIVQADLRQRFVLYTTGETWIGWEGGEYTPEYQSFPKEESFEKLSFAGEFRSSIAGDTAYFKFFATDKKDTLVSDEIKITSSEFVPIECSLDLSKLKNGLCEFAFAAKTQGENEAELKNAYVFVYSKLTTGIEK